GERQTSGAGPCPLQPANRRGPASRGPEHEIQSIADRLETADHAADFLQQASAAVALVAALHPVGDGLDMILETSERQKRRIELLSESRLPHVIGRKIIQQPENPSRFPLYSRIEPS